MTDYRPMLDQWMTDAEANRHAKQQQAAVEATALANMQPSAPVIPGQEKQPDKPAGHSPEMLRLLDHISAPHLRRF